MATTVDASARALDLVEQALELLRTLQDHETGDSDHRYTLLFGIAEAWEHEDAAPVFNAAYDLLEGLKLDDLHDLHGRVRADIVKILDRFGYLHVSGITEPRAADAAAARELIAALDDLTNVVHAVTAIALLAD